MPKTLAVKLNALAQKLVKQGHPWIFSDSIVKINKEGKTGDIAVLFDNHTDKVFAIGLYDEESPIRIKVLNNQGPSKLDFDFFKGKIEKAFALRQPLLQTETNTYRLIFGENDGFPGLITDIYAGMGVVKLYSGIWFPYLNDIVRAIAEISGVECLVLRMSRNLQKQEERFKEGSVLYGELTNPEIEFKEYGVRFKTDVLRGHKTGFFLDHRENRRRIGEMANGKRVLDVFSYNGGFSVHALAGGAKEVTSLDFSKQALELALENGKLNNPSGKHIVLDGDAFVLLKELAEQKKKYDVVIIDPPSFAKSQREKEIALKKYAELARLGVALTEKRGLLLLASCSSRISSEEFLNVHTTEFNKLGISYKQEGFTQHDIDHPITFPEGAYLKSAYYRIL